MTTVIGPALVLGPVVVATADSTETTDVTGAVTVSGGSPQITETSTAPVDTPVALRRGADGLFRPDVAAIADRPTRTEVTDGVTAHAIDPTPHPEYDDMPSLSLLFRNRLV